MGVLKKLGLASLEKQGSVEGFKTRFLDKASLRSLETARARIENAPYLRGPFIPERALERKLRMDKMNDVTDLIRAETRKRIMEEPRVFRKAMDAANTYGINSKEFREIGRDPLYSHVVEKARLTHLDRGLGSPAGSSQSVPPAGSSQSVPPAGSSQSNTIRDLKDSRRLRLKRVGLGLAGVGAAAGLGYLLHRRLKKNEEPLNESAALGYEKSASLKEAEVLGLLQIGDALGRALAKTEL